MFEAAEHKPSYDEWKNWVKVIIDRMTKVVHVYTKPPYSDTVIRNNERQLKVEILVDLLRRLHSTLDNNASVGTLPEAELAARDDQAIASLQPLIRDVLRRLPTVSDDMQFLLKSPWFENCTGRAATEIFCGPSQHLNEGIGSGRPEHGRLPEILTNMLEREQYGDIRPPRELTADDAHLARRAAVIRRRTSSSFGSAGRVD